jgi:hypothetical protein
MQQSFAAFTAMVGLLSGSAFPAAAASDYAPPPAANTLEQSAETRQAPSFVGDAPLASAPAVSSNQALPEGTQWRYSEFINAVQVGAAACGEHRSARHPGSNRQAACLPHGGCALSARSLCPAWPALSLSQPCMAASLVLASLPPAIPPSTPA